MMWVSGVTAFNHAAVTKSKSQFHHHMQQVLGEGGL